jgi:hypothetical protein
MQTSEHPFVLLAIAAERLDSLPAEEKPQTKQEFRTWLQRYNAEITSTLAGGSGCRNDEPARYRELREMLASRSGHPFVLLGVAVDQIHQLPAVEQLEEFRIWLRLYDLMIYLELTSDALMNEGAVEYDEALIRDGHPTGYTELGEKLWDLGELRDLAADALDYKQSDMIGRLVEAPDGLGFDIVEEDVFE